MITVLRKRLSGEISSTDDAITALKPQKITLSAFFRMTPSLRHSVFLGFAKNGEYVLAINDESVILDPFFPHEITSQCRPACTRLAHSQNGSLLDKRVLVLVHTESHVVATLMFHNALDSDRSLSPDVGLKIFAGPKLICNRLIHARADGHHIYDNYADIEHGSSVVTVNGGYQMYFFLVAGDSDAPAEDKGCIGMKRPIESRSHISESYPCRSKWYWSSSSSCTCEDCRASQITPPDTQTSEGDGDSAAAADWRLSMEVEIDCDLLAISLLQMCFPQAPASPEDVITESRLLSPSVPSETSFSSVTLPSRLSTAFHAILGLCVRHNDKVLYVGWQLIIHPWQGKVHIQKVEDLVGFCKKMRIKGKPAASRGNFISHAAFLRYAIDQYAVYVSRRIDTVAMTVGCNKMCEEFKSPALDGATKSVLQIKHPTLPFAVYNDELFDTDGSPSASMA